MQSISLKVFHIFKIMNNWFTFIFIILTFYNVCIFGANSGGRSTPSYLNVNDMADSALPHVRKLIKQLSFDPMILPNISEVVNSVPLNLTNGYLEGLSNVKRKGPFTLGVTLPAARTFAVVGFDQLKATFHYSFTATAPWYLGGLSYTDQGSMVAVIKNVTAKMSVYFIVDKLRFQNPTLQIVNYTDIDVKMHSSCSGIICDTISSIQEIGTNALMPFFKTTVIDVCQKNALKVVNEYIQTVNNNWPDWLEQIIAVGFEKVVNRRPNTGNSQSPSNSNPRPGTGGNRPPNNWNPRPGTGNNQPPNNWNPRPGTGSNRPPNNWNPRPGTGNNQPPNNWNPRPGTGNNRPPNTWNPRPGTGNNQPPNNGKPRPSTANNQVANNGNMRPGTGNNQPPNNWNPRPGTGNNQPPNNWNPRPGTGNNQPRNNWNPRPGSGNNRYPNNSNYQRPTNYNSQRPVNYNNQRPTEWYNLSPINWQQQYDKYSREIANCLNHPLSCVTYNG